MSTLSNSIGPSEVKDSSDEQTVAWFSYLYAFVRGALEFRHSFTTRYEGSRAEAYDWGRELAHRATLRRFES